MCTNNACNGKSQKSFFFLLCLSHQKLFLHQEKILYQMIDVDYTSLKMLIFFFLLTGTALIMAVSTSQ